MRVGIEFGQDRLEVEVRDRDVIGVSRSAPAEPLADPSAALRDALENPLGFPALRRALTPDDHVTVVVDEKLPQLPALVTAILEHLGAARVAPEAVTLLCPRSGSTQPWLADLPDAFQEVHVEVHDPANRKHLSYLATTRRGRRLYLNRTAVDADQLVVLSGWRYDPLLGYSGGEGALYPALSDEATRQEMCGRLSMAAPGGVAWPVQREAEEAAWLLGAPFFVHVIEGAGEEIIHVVAGLQDTSAEARRLLDARWRGTVGKRAETVVASISGNVERQDFADLARALACAARVAQPHGRIILVTQAAPELGPGAQLVRQSDDPARALTVLNDEKPPDMAAAFQWASSVQKAKVYLLSGLPAETAEEFFAIPLENAGQVQRLLANEQSCLFLADAHKSVVVPEK